MGMDMLNVLTALAKATGEMRKISKDSRNAEQKYDFASVDDFFSMVAPIYAAHGLITHADEVSVEGFERQGKFGSSQWLRIVYRITTYHVSGESLPPVLRTVEVVRTGAQSFGSAQSYVLKQHLRGLHMISTGDKDADASEKGEGPITTKQNADDKTPAQSLADAWRDGVEDSLPPNATPDERAEAFAKAIAQDFRSKGGVKALENAWRKHEGIIKAMEARYPQHFDEVVDAYELAKLDIEDKKGGN